MLNYSDPHYLHLFKEMYDAVRTTRLKDMKLVWVDEAVFTFNTLGKRAWSSKFKSISVKDIDFKVKTTAIIALISIHEILPKIISSKLKFLRLFHNTG